MRWWQFKITTEYQTMSDFLLSHLGSIGLFLDIIGVSILFFVIVTIGEQVILADEDEDIIRERKKRKKEIILKIGYGLIFFGFILQLLSNEMNNSIMKEMKSKIENCNSSNGQTSNQITSDEIKGSWYRNKWTSYHTLIFSDKTVFVDNNVDTVFTLNYSFAHDTLITWTGQTNQKFKNKIISITKDNLVLDGIQEIVGTRIYSRTKDNQNK